MSNGYSVLGIILGLNLQWWKKKKSESCSHGGSSGKPYSMEVKKQVNKIISYYKCSLGNKQSAEVVCAEGMLLEKRVVRKLFSKKLILTWNPKVEYDPARQTDGKRTFQAEGIALVEALPQEDTWHIPETQGRLECWSITRGWMVSHDFGERQDTRFSSPCQWKLMERNNSMRVRPNLTYSIKDHLKKVLSKSHHILETECLCPPKIYMLRSNPQWWWDGMVV